MAGLRLMALIRLIGPYSKDVRLQDPLVLSMITQMDRVSYDMVLELVQFHVYAYVSSVCNINGKAFLNYYGQ